MLKAKVVNTLTGQIKNNFPEYSDVKLEEIKYGIESLYLFITKLVIISFVSYMLGQLTNLIIFSFFFGLLRFNGFGIHAKTSFSCLISSSITLIGFPYLSQLISFNKIIVLLIGVLSICIFYKYAPADTHKRPLINKKKKRKNKILIISTTFIFIFFSFTIKNELIISMMVFSLILESVSVLPITYKIFDLPYNNYKNYSE